jgi:hypothetical protein
MMEKTIADMPGGERMAHRMKEELVVKKFQRGVTRVFKTVKNMASYFNDLMRQSKNQQNKVERKRILDLANEKHAVAALGIEGLDFPDDVESAIIAGVQDSKPAAKKKNTRKRSKDSKRKQSPEKNEDEAPVVRNAPPSPEIPAARAEIESADDREPAAKRSKRKQSPKKKDQEN